MPLNDWSAIGGIAASIPPLTTTYLAWQYDRDAGQSCSALRQRLFAGGLITATLCCLIVICCFVQPLPLIHNKDGGYTEANSWFFLAAFSSDVVTFALAFFGIGKARLLLLASSALLFVLTYLAVVSYAI